MSPCFILCLLVLYPSISYPVEGANGNACKDHHPKCVKWAAKGECKKNPSWMLQHCQHSCGKCSQVNIHDLLERAKSQEQGDLMIIPYVVIAVVIAVSIKIYFSGANCNSDAKLKGKTVIITGANGGLGKEVARDLAWRKARVILACRDVHQGMEVAGDMVASTKNMDVEVKKLDLSSYKSIREFAKEVNQEEDHVDVLINNAGYFGLYQKTSDGMERTLQVNYLGPFLLTHLLLDKLKASGPSRIVNVTSRQHHSGHINFDDLQREKKYGAFGFAAYNQSKLALVMFTRQLANKLQGTKVTVNCVHPGVVATGMMNHFRFLRLWVIRPLYWLTAYFFFKTPIQGSQPIIHCAVAPELADVSGGYFVDCQQTECSDKAKDEGVAKKLWELSEHLCGLRRDDM